MEENEHNTSDSEEVLTSILEFLTPVWDRRFSIIRISFYVGVITAGISLLMPERYESTATVMPQMDETGLAGASAIGNLASLAGLSKSTVSLTELYPVFFQSESVLGEVLKCRFQAPDSNGFVLLSDLWGIDDESEIRRFEKAYSALLGAMEIDLDRKTNIITILVRAGDPMLATAILDSLLAKTDEFVSTKQRSYAREQRIWIDARLKEVRGDLKASEDSLKKFREQNRRVIDSPELLLIQERLQRDVSINTAIYTELKKQYELIRIDEIKSIPILNILDPPRPPGLRSWPRRTLMVLVAVFAAFGLSVGYVIARQQYGELILRFYRSFDLEKERALWRRIRSRFFRSTPGRN